MEDTLKRITAKKQQLDQRQPFPAALEKNLADWLKVELTYSSNAIEGNTLTRIETAEVIKRGNAAVISGKSLKDQLEAINHAKALDFITELADKRRGHQFLTERDIQAIHRIVLTGIDDQWAGKYRQTEVFIRGSNAEFPLPQAVPYAMIEFVQWLQGTQDVHPVRLAADIHFKFVNIHPFVDGNGRTARLLMNLVLTMHGYPMAVIRNEDRTQYLTTFEVAHAKNDMQPFYTVIETAIERSLDMYLNALQGKRAMPKLHSSLPKASKNLLKIGELAQVTGETLHTLRFWTKAGLLSVSGQTPGGYLLYHPDTIERVKYIRRLQDKKRLTLDEIRGELKNAA